VDTTGAASPEAIRFLLEVMQQAGNGIPVEVHCHDDFGFATANTVAGALHGAEYVSTTVNGIGERAGNAPLEEVATSLAYLYGVETGLRLERLAELSALVERFSGVAVQRHKAVVGANAFSHESGLVVAGVVRDPFTAEAYAPELVGRRREIVLGKKSGRASIEAKLRELSADAADEVDVDAVLAAVKARSLAEERPIDDDEFIEMVTTTRKGGAA
jgi:isopropylmalate/homocitrate/citramalate synthase